MICRKLSKKGFHRLGGILHKTLIQQAGLGIQGLQLAGKICLIDVSVAGSIMHPRASRGFSYCGKRRH